MDDIITKLRKTAGGLARKIGEADETHRPTLDLTTCLEEIITDFVPGAARVRTYRSRTVIGLPGEGARRRPGASLLKLSPTISGRLGVEDGEGTLLRPAANPTPHGEILYLIYVYTPRFFTDLRAAGADADPRALPHRPGLRRHAAPHRQARHGASREQFNDNLQPLVERYLATCPTGDAMAVLREGLQELSRRATLVGRTLPVRRRSGCRIMKLPSVFRFKSLRF